MVDFPVANASPTRSIIIIIIIIIIKIANSYLQVHQYLKKTVNVFTTFSSGKIEQA